MEEEIIKLLNTKRYKYASFSLIKDFLEIDEESLKKLLKSLEMSGIIYKDEEDKYTLLSNTKYLKGVIKAEYKRPARVILDNNKVLNIEYEDKNIRDKDVVLIEENKKKKTASIVKTIKRNYKDFTGEVIKDKDLYKAVSKTGEVIILDKPYPLGYIILVDGKYLYVKDVLGHKDSPDTMTKSILLKHGFAINFSLEYQKELLDIPNSLTSQMIEEEIKNGRRDLRYLPHVTIDGEDTKDFDDAVCYHDGYLYISIADLSKIIKEGSVIDTETISRKISVYPPGMVNPMIHHKISNGIGSLIPNEDSLTKTTIYKIEEDGNIKPVCLCDSLINSKLRMTYENVNKYLEDNNVVDSYEKYTSMLDNLYKIAMKVKKNILQNGFLEFSSDEVKTIIEDNKVLNIKSRYNGKAEETIEFLMLLENMTRTAYFKKHNLPYIARVHDEPDDGKLYNYNKLLIKRGYKGILKSHYTKVDIINNLESYKGVKEQMVLDKIAVKCQSKAYYASSNTAGHFALGLCEYATFTSPIRRLADYINQRIYDDSIKYGCDYAREKWAFKIDYLAKICTYGEMASDDVEKITTDIRKAEYISKFAIGTVFEGIISKVESSSIEVLIPGMMIYETVKLNGKNYYLSKDGFSIHDKKDNNHLVVGDTINVSLYDVNINDSKIRFVREGECCEKEEKKGKSKVKKR